MRISGIIAEYNPFHNGHLHHMDVTRASGTDGIVCILGSNFTQRGDAALLSKSARTLCALKGGADLVIELPAPYSLAAAADFAYGAVYLLNGLGCINVLSFGSEHGNTDELLACAEAIVKNGQNIKAFLRSGIGYAAAVQSAVSQNFATEFGSMLEKPNNILAVEYIAALNRLASGITPFAVKRKGAGHDGLPEDDIPSASFLRNQLKQGADIKRFIPPTVFDVMADEISKGRAPVYLENLDMAVLSRLRALSRRDLENAPAASEGLNNRIFNAIRKARSLEQVIEFSKTKRYTTARIRRICISAAIGLPKRPPLPGYIRVLGFSKKGESILKIAKHTSLLPIVTSVSQIEKLGVRAKKQLHIECAATDLYALGSPAPQHCGLEMTTGVIKI